jgi:hypothetical protein
VTFWAEGALLMLKLIALILFTLAASPTLAQTAHSLDQVPGLLKTPEAKRNFAEQIQGTQAPDGLGVRLPPSLSAEQIIALLVPASDKTPVSIVRAKPMPGQVGAYVAIVCTGGFKPGPSDTNQCDQSNIGAPRPDMRVYLGLIEAKDGAPPRLIAKPVKVDEPVNWRDTNLPDAPDTLDDSQTGFLTPDYFTVFDLAAYWIAPGQRAFGLRGEWNIGYAGGGATYDALYLFAVVDGELKQVLAIPMSFFKDIAGDWHKDGTRDHDLTEGANVLIVTAHSTAGHFDLLAKARDGKSSRLYKWSPGADRYEDAK